MAHDLELLERWRHGDKSAGGELFHRHFAALRRFFRNKVSYEESEDLVQKTFLACVEGRERFRGDSSFRTYLFAAARRILYRHLEKRHRDVVNAGLDMSVSSLHDLGASPSGVAAANEQQARVLAALRHIPVEMQLMMELFYWEEMKGPELAAVMDIAETTVRTRLHRARARLKAELEKMADEPTPVDAMDDWARSLRETLVREPG